MQRQEGSVALRSVKIDRIKTLFSKINKKIQGGINLKIDFISFNE